MVRVLLGLTACAAVALADIAFNVVGLRRDEDDSFGVMVNGKMHKLTTTPKTYPVWSVKVAGVNAPVAYKYVHLNEDDKVDDTEKTMRKLPANAIQTPNEFFGRRQSLYSIPPLPQVYDNKLVQNSPFFREGYISNLFIHSSEADFKKLNKVGGHDNIKVKVQYVGANENVVINNVEMALSGQSTRDFAKLAYQFKFPEKTPLLDLTTLKLRSGENDETMMREKLYIDLLNDIGVPAQQAGYIRVFWNERPIGLFVAMEEMKENWIRKVLHPEVASVKIGSVWKMNSYDGKTANLGWQGPTSKSYILGDIYKPVVKGVNVPKNDVMKDLIGLMKDLKDYNPKTNPDPVAFWDQRLELDTFLKSMAMEYLTAAWDAYWQSGSNYQLHHDLVTNKWVWLPMDFDDTFGNSFGGHVESYKKLSRNNNKGDESFLVSKLIMDTPAINKKFEEHLKAITSTVFKPQAINPRLDAYLRMIEEDVAWDRKLPRVAAGGKSYHYKLADLYKGVQKDLKGWVQKRSAQVQKDMKFKAPAVVASRVPNHNMHPMQLSAYGIKAQSVDPKTVKTPSSAPASAPAPAKAPAPASVPEAEQKPIHVDEKKPEPPAAAAVPSKEVQKASSASIIGFQWAAGLGTFIVAVILSA
ncbi:hypothetical protein DFQ26_002277 [Actinomortierella ambigua]|nr:hypothetical protein DFQ26_002277 [Actinomortierella ambigua]